MENITTKGFCELNETEMMDIDGGSWWRKIKNVAKDAAPYAAFATIVVLTAYGVPIEPALTTVAPVIL